LSRQFRPIPYGVKLAPTLAQRVNQLREIRNLTVRDLAQATKIEFSRIEDIEGGLETWLSVTDRQVLARALGVEPRVLQEVEARQASSSEEVQHSAQQNLYERILAGDRDLQCPNCSGMLKCSVQEAFDIAGMPARFPKAFCVKCPYVLK
jgi:transcriptional regulator with XRE-family HTH domain